MEAQVTREALILRALRDLNVPHKRLRPVSITTQADNMRMSPRRADQNLSFASGSVTSSPPSYESPGYFYNPNLNIIDNTVESSASGMSISDSGTESASRVISDFFSDSGSFSSSLHSEFDATEAKLALWQAILVGVGLCQGVQGEIVTDVKRPPHFPDPPFPVPDSLSACRKLIQENVFLNIVNFKKSQLKKEPLLLFANNTEMAEYTKKYARFVRLSKAKQDLLQPLLRNFMHTPGLAVINERVPSGGDSEKLRQRGNEKDFLGRWDANKVIVYKIKTD